MSSFRFRKRVREIEFEKIDEIKKSLNLKSYKLLAQLMNCSLSQINNYKRCNAIPASRYYAIRDALLVKNEDDYIKSRNKIIDLFK